MIDFHLTSLVYRTKGISITTVYLILSKREGPGPGPLVQNMVIIGPRPGAPRSQRVKRDDTDAQEYTELLHCRVTQA